MHTMEQKLNKLLTQKVIRWDDAIMTVDIVEYWNGEIVLETEEPRP